MINPYYFTIKLNTNVKINRCHSCLKLTNDLLYDTNCKSDGQMHHDSASEPQFNKDQPVFTHINSSHARLNLQGWASGGCPISAFILEFRPKGGSRLLQVADSIFQQNQIRKKFATLTVLWIETKKERKEIRLNPEVCVPDAGTWAWQNVRTNATTDVFLAELREATWYELKMKACNSAGCGNQSSQFATLDYDGSEYMWLFFFFFVV